MTRWRVHGRLVKQTAVSTVEKTLKKALCFVCVCVCPSVIKASEGTPAAAIILTIQSALFGAPDQHKRLCRWGRGGPHFSASQMKTISEWKAELQTRKILWRHQESLESHGQRCISAHWLFLKTESEEVIVVYVLLGVSNVSG